MAFTITFHPRGSQGGARPPGPTVSNFRRGGSGTGKTELAKALAENLFHDERRLIRFDMSEFMEEHSVAKLIGAPPGYVGHDEGGQFSDAIRTFSYSVVLFDEDLPTGTGIAPMPEFPNGPRVSSPERALLEMLSEVGVYQEVEEARSIMEGVRQLSASRHRTQCSTSPSPSQRASSIP